MTPVYAVPNHKLHDESTRFPTTGNYNPSNLRQAAAQTALGAFVDEAALIASKDRQAVVDGVLGGKD